jgi:hypothetical protein
MMSFLEFDFELKFVMPGLSPGHPRPSSRQGMDGRDVWREDALRAFARL